ncbi:hypothetical protein [Actinoplanes sp. NPDC051851]|uniref:hypothetical protein n=1 Tax=Actinoplanes sp. NPDC051851 TaxID=3154753 RepID=UPI0034184C31
MDVYVRVDRIEAVIWSSISLPGGREATTVKVPKSLRPWSIATLSVPLSEQVGKDVNFLRRLSRWLPIFTLLAQVAVLGMGAWVMISGWSSGAESEGLSYIPFLIMGALMVPLPLIPGIFAVRRRVPRVVNEWLIIPNSEMEAAIRFSDLNSPEVVQVKAAA